MAKFHLGAKDGGPESLVWCWGFESKAFGSIMLLNFKKGSRKAYHTHAFHALSWILTGHLFEEMFDSDETVEYTPSIKPVFTHKDRFHKVTGIAKSTWVLTFRNGWVDKWLEYNEHGHQTLTHGRKLVNG